MEVRSGYLHAIEGVLAALIVVLYLNSIIATPPAADWTETSLSKQSEDVLAAMDRSGFLDEVVMRDDRDSFSTLLRQLDESVQYQIDINGLPHTHPRVAVLVNNTSTYENETTKGDWGGGGLPDSENDNYHQGNLSGPAFGDVGFVLSDTEGDGFFAYTSVNFDLNGDGDFGDPGEGPFSRGDTFTCDKGVTGCTDDAYSPGPFNDTPLVLYNASLTARLQNSIANTTLGERTVEPAIETANPTRQTIDPFDALIARWNASELSDHKQAINTSVADGALLIIVADVAASEVESGYLNDLGFSFIEEFDINGSGQDTDIFYSLHDPRNDSYYPASFYGMAAVTTTDFSGGQGTLTIQSQDIGVKRYDSGAVAFGTEDYAANYTTGDSVTLLANTYTVQEIAPLELRPDGQQQFESYGTGRVAGDISVMRMRNPRFNTSEYDTAANYTEKYQKKTDLPKRYDQGVAGTACDFADYPYRLGNVTVGIDSPTNYTFLLVNFETVTPCDEYHEFVYFDLNDDGDFDDDQDKAAGHSGEGPFQDGETVTIPVNQSYTVDPFDNGNGTALNRVGPRFVGELPLNREVFGGGTTALIGRNIPGHDDLAVINALLLSETRDTAPFTPRRTLGDTSVGYTYSSMAGEDVKLPYTLNTVWWFR